MDGRGRPAGSGERDVGEEPLVAADELAFGEGDRETQLGHARKAARGG
jgi:hypothetical protein